ncbi:hypothetical protein ACFYUY_24030 [Kitasatospora sp. NPDC004745]|uniref:hypothetical protein n=1 Tax=Kitasatospora sp. NPDC004745 TaxID=3364019 RepID=UPI0036986FD6
MSKPMAPDLTAGPIFALNELGVRTPWRGTGAARRIHEGLAGNRPEERITLMVNPAASDGKVLALYESWGYAAVNEVQPKPGRTAARGNDPEVRGLNIQAGPGSSVGPACPS